MPKYRRGSGSIYRRGKVWWLSYYTETGQHVCESSGIKDGPGARKAARDKLDAKIGQRAEGRLMVGADRVTFEALMGLVENDYKANQRRSLDKVLYRQRHLAKAFAGFKAKDIGLDEIRAYVARRQEEHASNGEINRELDTLRRGFNLALQSEKIARAPKVPRLKEAAPRAGFFEQADFDAVLPHLPEYLQPPMTFAYCTGWRCRSEVLKLPWRNVDFEAGTIRLDVGTTKTDDGRLIYMSAALRHLLEAQRQRTLAVQRDTGRIIGLVFHNQGEPIANYYKAWHRACRAAGLSGKIPHDFRRTAVRNMVRAGIPERVAMQMAGHRTRSVFDRYHIVSEGDLRDAARRLEAAFPNATATFSATVHPLSPVESPVSARNS